MNGYIKYILKLLNKCDVYLVFGRYYEYSPKCVTRSGRAGKASSNKHKTTPTMLLTMQKILLNCTANKVQLIGIIICEKVIEKAINMQTICRSFKNRLIVTGLNLIPQQAYEGLHQEKEDMTTTNEEADVIIPQQVVNAVKQRSNCIKDLCDDTDVFALLLHFYVQEKLTCPLFMEETMLRAHQLT